MISLTIGHIAFLLIPLNCLHSSVVFFFHLMLWIYIGPTSDNATINASLPIGLVNLKYCLNLV